MLDTSWDVDKYKSEHESEQHWGLRRQFMVAHKNKYPEPTLVCLTQVFFNMEFLGCKYPEKTMKLVNELAAEVAQEFRESRKNNLKRTFVGAQDAAGAKAKGVKPPAGAVQGAEAEEKGSVAKRPCQDQESVSREAPTATEKPRSSKADIKPMEDTRDHTADLREVSKTFTFMIPTRNNSKTEMFAESVMHFNFPKPRMTLKFEGTKADGWQCELRVNPSVGPGRQDKPALCVGSSFAMTQKEAREQASANAVNNLKKFCTYVEPNPEFFQNGGTPDFIKNRTPCTKNPRSYLILTKKNTGHITPEVADTLIRNFKSSSNEDMYFLQTEYKEKEKITLMNLCNKLKVGFRHFGEKTMMKDHHICIYKVKSAEEIVEEARKLNWKHPKYLVTLKND